MYMKKYIKFIKYKMKKIVISLTICFLCIIAKAQEHNHINTIDSLERKISELQVELTHSKKLYVSIVAQEKELSFKLDSLDSRFQKLLKEHKTSEKQIRLLHNKNSELENILDSLSVCFNDFILKQQKDNQILSDGIEVNKSTIEFNASKISNRTTLVLLVSILITSILLIMFLAFKFKIKKNSMSLKTIKEAQNSLEKAHSSLLAESVKLDNRLIEIVEKQISLIQQNVPNNNQIQEQEIDHSLALKVADEITRIEANLAKMDSSIKGYRQLSKAIERIKDNFSANDYEIVDMLGKQYTPGMRAAVTFISDESLSGDVQIITRIIKPQVNFKQEMIQAAQIEVSQPE